MNLARRPDGWWIVKVPGSVTECGPYRDKQEAAGDLAGLRRFFEDELCGTDGQKALSSEGV